MSDYALKKDKIIDVNSFDDISWKHLKDTYEIGELKMLCCELPAIPKTSINFKKFFAHHFDECNTAPESIWHKTAKRLVLESLLKLGIDAIEEKIGNGWKADIYFELDNRKIVFELQKSPQTLPTYIERQLKYKKEDIETYWLLFPPRYKTITKAIGKYKLKHELNNIPPQGGFFPSLENLPILFLDDETLEVKGAGLFKHTIDEVVTAICEKRLVHLSTWVIV